MWTEKEGWRRAPEPFILVLCIQVCGMKSVLQSQWKNSLLNFLNYMRVFQNKRFHKCKTIKKKEKEWSHSNNSLSTFRFNIPVLPPITRMGILVYILINTCLLLLCSIFLIIMLLHSAFWHHLKEFLLSMAGKMLNLRIWVGYWLISLITCILKLE